jgi:hypothetical protein
MDLKVEVRVDDDSIDEQADEPLPRFEVCRVERAPDPAE